MADPYWIVLWVFSSLWLLFSLIFLFRVSHEPIKSRQPSIVLFQQSTALAHLIAITVSIHLHANGADVSCQVTHFTSAFFLPFWGYPFFLRALHLWYNFRVSELNYLQHEDFISGKSKTSVPALPPLLKLRSQIPDLIFNLISLTILVVIFIIIILPVHYADSLPTNIPTDEPLDCLGLQKDVITAQFALACALIIVFSVFMYDVVDAFYVKIELIATAACFVPLYILWVISVYSSDFPSPYSHFYIDLTLIFCSLIISLVIPAFMSFSFLAFSHSYDEEYRKIFTRNLGSLGSSSRRSSQHSDLVQEASEGADLAAAGDSTFFKFVLENDILAKSFEKFAIECRNTEALYFYRNVQKFRRIKDDAERLEEAKRIAKEFLDPEAPCAIKIPADMKEEVMRRIENGNANPSLFHRAEVLVFIQMRHKAYPIWRKSKSFRIVLQEAGVNRPLEDYQFDFERPLSQSIREALRHHFQSTISLFGTRSSRQSDGTSQFSSVGSHIHGSVSSTMSTDGDPTRRKEPPRRPSIVWEKNEEEFPMESNLDGIPEEAKAPEGNLPDVKLPLPKTAVPDHPPEKIQADILARVSSRKKHKHHVPGEAGSGSFGDPSFQDSFLEVQEASFSTLAVEN